MVNPLEHFFYYWANDRDDKAWCLKVGWRITNSISSWNASTNMEPPRFMCEKWGYPRRGTRDRYLDAAVARIKRRAEKRGTYADEKDPVLPYTDAEIDCFFPNNEWLIHHPGGPGLKELKLCDS